MNGAWEPPLELGHSASLGKWGRGLAAAPTQVWALEFMGAGRLEKVDERGPSAPSTAR